MSEGLKSVTIKDLYTLDETIAKDIFESVTYPWEVLPKISEFIIKLGNTLPEEKYEKREGNIWIAKTAKSISVGIYRGTCNY